MINSLDLRRSFGLFMVTTKLGRRYYVTALNKRVVSIRCDALNIDEPRARVTSPGCDRIIRVGQWMTITPPGGSVRYSHSAITHITRVGWEEFDGKRLNGEFSIATEGHGVFTVLADANSSGEVLIQHPEYYRDEPVFGFLHEPDWKGKAIVGAPLLVVRSGAPSSEGSQQFSRVLSIRPS